MTEWIGSVIDAILGFPPAAVAVFFFLSGLIEIIFQPWPGTTILVFGGCISAMGFPYGWLLICMMFWMGESCGSYIVYEIGERGGNKVLDWPVIGKVITPGVRGKFTKWITEYGSGMLVIAKFTAGVNTAAILFAGVARLPRRKAYSVIGGACAVHNIVFFLIGTLIGGSWEDVLAFMGEYNKLAIWIGVALLVLYIGWKLFAYMRKKRKQSLEGEEE